MKLNGNCLPSDQRQRDEIVSLTGESIFVEASAGSGKTSILVDRMINMVLEGIDIRKVSAITYTNAAAREFYERFQKKLSERAQKESDPVRHERLIKAAEDIDLCFMGTIDSFCSMILSEHPIRAGIPIGAHILDEKEYEQAILHEYAAIAKGEYTDALKQMCDEYITKVDDPQTVFCKVTKSLLEYLDYPVPTLPVLKADELQRQCSPLMSTFSEIYNFIKNNVSNITVTGSIKKWENYNKMTEHPALDSRACTAAGTYLYKELLRIINDMDGLDGIQVNGDIGSMGLSPDAKAWFVPNKTAQDWELGLRKTFKGAYSLNMKKCACSTALKMLKDEQYAIAMDFCIKACEQVEKKLKDSGKLYYNTLLYYLRNMLRDDAKADGKLIKHISKRHSHFLIDEFQDTNPMQSEIFFYLAAEEPVENWADCRARKGSLFIVGDPKQSIYSFQGSDERQFQLVRDKFDETKGGFGKVIVMTFNFRSSYKLCSWFDEKFSRLMGSKYPAILSGADTSSIKMASPGVLDGCWSLSAAEYGEKEALDLIKKLIKDPQYMLDGDPPRRIEYKDIMIITTNKKETDIFANTLKSVGIPVKVVGSVAFAKNKVLDVLAKLTAAAADTYDSAALYSVLTSPLFSFTDTRLVALGWGEKARSKKQLAVSLRDCIWETEQDEKTHKKTYVYLDETDDKDVIAAAEAIRSVRNDSYNMSAAAVIQKAADDLKLLAKMGSDEMQLFYYAIELIRAGEISGEISSLKQAAEKLDNLIKSKPKDNDHSLSLNDDPNSVYIANLHKVKGLERPIVILGIKKRNWSVQIKQALVYKADQRQNVIFSIESSKENNNSNIIETSSFDSLKEQALQDRLEQLRRDNYVAATRAGNALFICNKEEKEDPDIEERLNKHWKALCVDDSANVIAPFKLDSVPAMTRPAGADNGEELYSDAVKNSSLNELKDKLKATYIFESPNEKKIGSKFRDNAHGGPDKTNDDDGAQQTTPRRYASIRSDFKGTLVHRLMELLVLSRKKAYDKLDVLIEQVIEELGEELSQEQLTDAKHMLAEVADTMLNKGGFKQAGKAPQDLISELFDEQTEEIFCELPICYESGGAIVYGIIDLLYVKQGRWHIIDYKTDRDANSAVTKHAPQLEAYRQAIINLKGEQVSEENIDANVYNVNVN